MTVVIGLKRKVLAELVGTALLFAVVIGSGIVAERLAGGNVAIALLANTLATVGGLYVLIEVFGPVSGAHFNPAVSAVMTLRGALSAHELLRYIAAQLIGALGRCMARTCDVRSVHRRDFSQGSHGTRPMDC